MSDKTIEGGAGPALAAHSKDASAPSKNPASSAAPKPRAPARKVRSAASKVAAAVSNEVEASGGLGKLEGMARENPITAMLATGILGLIVGSLLART